MTATPDKAGFLLKEGIALLRAAYLAQGVDKSIRAIDDELGCAIGKEGHTIRKWKSGEIPLAAGFHDEFLREAETLTQWMIEKGRPYADGRWGERFLTSVGHPTAKLIYVTPSATLNPTTTGVESGRQDDNIRIEIAINLHLPRAAFTKKLERWLWRLQAVMGGAGRFNITES